MSEALVLGAAGTTLSWGSAAFSRSSWPAPQRKQPQVGNAWLSAEDVAHLLLSGEFLDAGVAVPTRFAPQAVASAVSSVERWRDEGRIFAIHDLYPRYQFDSRGRPHPAVERTVKVLGAEDVLRLGSWFSSPNRYLEGRRPQELLSIAPVDVLRALEHAVIAD